MRSPLCPTVLALRVGKGVARLAAATVVTVALAAAQAVAQEVAEVLAMVVVAGAAQAVVVKYFQTSGVSS